ncbi:MAG: hydroxymyristoyl-ACP dehydratase [Salinivirgaceae bacterium]|nr:hydroxymyristoyl-ACP dehydratase [Salinivirgaceae bacterium]
MSRTITGSDILALIPQRSPVVMVDAFYGIEDGVSHTGLTVGADNIFCSGNCLREPGIIEHIAQSAAARVGYIFTQKGETVPLGFIGSIDKLTIESLPPVGSQLHTYVTVMQEVGGVSLISAQTKNNDDVVAACRMKIFLKTE